MCSIAYEPCNEQSFKIGPSVMMNPNFNSMGNMNFMNPNGLNGINPINGLADMNALNMANLNMALASQNAAALMNSKFVQEFLS